MIGNGAFQRCSNLKDVLLNKGLQKIGTGVFYGCSSLESSKLSSTVSETNEAALGKCSNLKDVVLNEGLQKIGKAHLLNAHLWKVSNFLPLSLRLVMLHL